MIYIKTLTILALSVSLLWVIIAPGFDSIITLIGAISAVITAFVLKAKKSHPPQQQQSVSNSSNGIQAGGNINIQGDIGGNQNDK